MSSLGDRMKANYEHRYRRYLVRRIPVIIRVDGRAFHSWSRGLDKPFDLDLINTMVFAASEVSKGMQGFKLAYHQSDEVSFLLTDYDDINTDAWFGYVQSKVETIAAAGMTAYFNWRAKSVFPSKSLALFDARAFNIPESEIANYFLWRARDWERNSLGMYCSAHFSHKHLHGKGTQERHDLLHSKGLNWAADLTDQEKNGTWITRDKAFSDLIASYETINNLVTTEMAAMGDG